MLAHITIYLIPLLSLYMAGYNLDVWQSVGTILLMKHSDPALFVISLLALIYKNPVLFIVSWLFNAYVKIESKKDEDDNKE